MTSAVIATAVSLSSAARLRSDRHDAPTVPACNLQRPGHGRLPPDTRRGPRNHGDASMVVLVGGRGGPPRIMVCKPPAVPQASTPWSRGGRSWLILLRQAPKNALGNRDGRHCAWPTGVEREESIITSFSSISVRPLAFARARWFFSCSVLPPAMSAATVIRLRSRFDSSSRSQMSPNNTSSVRETSFGAKSPHCAGGSQIVRVGHGKFSFEVGVSVVDTRQHR